MKKLLALAAAAALITAQGAVKWKNLDEKSLLFGEKITEEDMLGKMVFIYSWSFDTEKSVELLKDVEKTWNAFRTKSVVLVGSLRGAGDAEKVKQAAEKHRVTFPIYREFDIDPSPKNNWEKVPYFLVVNHRGTVVYSGNGEKKATEALVQTITDMFGTPPLCRDVTFKKYKALEKQLVLGKNVSNILKTLSKEAEKQKDPVAQSEASEIISAVESAKDDVKQDIEVFSKVNPAEAVRLIGLFLKTWPKDDAAAEFKEQVPELKKAAAEKAKEDKAKARAKAKEAKEK